MIRTRIFAHRGANREAAENTRKAFEKALAHPIDGIETDIQLSRDEVAVLWHDDDLNKLGMPGRRIDDFDYAQLSEMDFAAHFPGADPEGVMSLRDFVTAYRSGCGLLLEIKKYAGELVARQQHKVRQTLETIDEINNDNILVSSFDLDSLIHAHGIAPQQPLVYNLEPDHKADFARHALSEHAFLHGLCVHISNLDRTMVEAVHGIGKFLAVYTCNSDEEIRRALTLAVDVLITDVSEKALRMRDG